MIAIVNMNLIRLSGATNMPTYNGNRNENKFTSAICLKINIYTKPREHAKFKKNRNKDKMK